MSGLFLFQIDFALFLLVLLVLGVLGGVFFDFVVHVGCVLVVFVAFFQFHGFLLVVRPLGFLASLRLRVFIPFEELCPSLRWFVRSGFLRAEARSPFILIFLEFEVYE